jgi:Putative metal-binding motif
MNRIRTVVNVVGLAAAVACSSSQGSGFGDAGGGGTGPITTPTGEGGGTTPPVGGSGTGTGPLHQVDSGGTTTPTGDSGSCASTPTNDFDGDGWTVEEGDCNDCNKYINPGAYDVPGDGIDEDCDGTPDDAVTNCDSMLSSVATTNGSDGATAMDICKTTTANPPLPMKTWGLISADYVAPDGTSSLQMPPSSYTEEYGCSYDSSGFNLGFGILGPTFGTSNVTQHGQHMLGLSSGTARQPTDPGYSCVSGFDKCSVSGAPSGFPGQTPACGNVMFGQPHDGAALRVVMRIPTNALTMSFDSNFFSYEFPDWVCSEYNDTYVVIMAPSPAGEPSTANDNIAFDSNNNIISVNAGFLRVCQPTTMAGAEGMGTNAGNYTYACPEGPGKLAGTGFDGNCSDGTGDGQDHASTDWLTTTVSVDSLRGQEVTLLFAIWDSSDGELDSTVLIDNVHWTFATAPNTPPPATAPPVTQPK